MLEEENESISSNTNIEVENTDSSKSSIYVDERDNYVNVPHVIALVGLPARGKTYMSKKLTRYLNWIGIKTRIFNLGEYRRNLPNKMSTAEYFSNNSEAMKIRNQIAIKALEDVFDWLDDDGEVAIFDATNTTIERRQVIHELVVVERKYKLFFVESICDIDEIIQKNIMEVKVGNPDYVGMETDYVLKDFYQRIANYQARYQPLDETVEKNYSFMKIINGGKKIIVYQQDGHIQAKIIYFLSNLHIGKRAMYFTRHGETEFNVVGKLGGDSHLTERGIQFADALANYILEQNINGLLVWTSWLRRTIQTAQYIPAPQIRLKALNEIDLGTRDEMTYAEIKTQFPEEFLARDLNKFIYRYPKGESYEDVVARVEPIIMELERRENVLVITDQAVLRCLLAYFLDKRSDELPYIRIPLHTIIKLIPKAYGCRVEYIKIPIQAVDTHRPKPKVPGKLESRFYYIEYLPLQNSNEFERETIMPKKKSDTNLKNNDFENVFKTYTDKSLQTSESLHSLRKNQAGHVSKPSLIVVPFEKFNETSSVSTDDGKSEMSGILKHDKTNSAKPYQGFTESDAQTSIQKDEFIVVSSKSKPRRKSEQVTINVPNEIVAMNVQTNSNAQSTNQSEISDVSSNLTDITPSVSQKAQAMYAFRASQIDDFSASTNITQASNQSENVKRNDLQSNDDDKEYNTNFSQIKSQRSHGQNSNRYRYKEQTNNQAENATTNIYPDFLPMRSQRLNTQTSDQKENSISTNDVEINQYDNNQSKSVRSNKINKQIPNEDFTIEVPPQNNAQTSNQKVNIKVNSYSQTDLKCRTCCSLINECQRTNVLQAKESEKDSNVKCSSTSRENCNQIDSKPGSFKKNVENSNSKHCSANR